MEVSKAEIDAVLDAHSRFVWTPHALTCEGQQNIPCDLQPGEKLDAFLRRHVPGIDSGAWSVAIGGIEVPRAMWGHVRPKHGHLIACRATAGKQAVQLVAIAALAYFSGGLAAGLYGAMGGTYVAASAGLMLSGLQMGIFMAGSMLINKVLGPKVPKAASEAAAKEVFSLSSQRNSARPYEPIPTLFGEMRVTPDLANQPYTLYEGDNQFLSTQLLGGINVHSAHDLSVGDTPLSDYEGVEVYYDGLAGHEQKDPPLWGNADSTAGAELNYETQAWVQRTTSVGAVQIQADVEGQLFDTGGSSGYGKKATTISGQYRAVGSDEWKVFFSDTITNSTPDVIRRTYSLDVEEGQYDVRLNVSFPIGGGGMDNSDTCKFSWVTLRTIQRDTTDYRQFGRIAIKIKATGQLSGSLDTVRATYRAKPMPVWTGTAWAAATTRDTGLSNPGAILLQILRGIKDAAGKLQFGFGLSDEQIDIEGLKAFMLHCAAKGYTYDRWVTGSVSLQEICHEVALAGMGEFSWTDGSRPTAVFVSSGQPVSAVVNMANMAKASFSVDYALSNAADGIEYQYVDRTKNFETVTLRVTAPGVETMLNPARITGEGVTTEAHAAVMARYHLAQSLYQYKTIGYTADIEHLDYRRLSVLSVSHDLTQWGFGGRVIAAKRVAGKVQITLDEVVPPLTTPHLGLRLPGDRDYRVWSVQALTMESDTLTLVGAWPAGVALPGEVDDAMDTLWCYDFKATPGYRVRVTSMEPEGDLKGAKITCVPEGPEFWTYVLTGEYEPAPNQSALPQLARPTVENLRVAEKVNVQGNTEWYELTLTWDTTGEIDHCQVWAGLDGSQPLLVDGNALQNRARVRVDQPGDWLLRVVPFDAAGRAGTAAALLYSTAQVGRAPWNPAEFAVQTVEGGLRRYVWQWGENRPANLAGVQIRYKAGAAAVVGDWDDMEPLGAVDDVYTAHFESSRPDAGAWVFGLRAINTSGMLAATMLTCSINLPDSLGELNVIDLTPPPAPTNLTATGMFSTVQVEWDAPLYEMGGGHKTTEVWASATANFPEAKKVAEGYGGPVSFDWVLGSDVYVWARFVTQHGVAGPFAGSVHARTAENVEQLLDVLADKITTSELHQSLSAPIELLQAVPGATLQDLATANLARVPVIDRIDKAGGPLGKSLLESAASLEATQQQVRHSIDDMAQGVLEAVLVVAATLERITDAGIVVDPVTGRVRQYALEATQEHVTNLEVLLDAVAGQLSLKATTAYVDGKIAAAVLSPADLLLYEGIDARLIAVTQTLDSINGVLAQKASQLELTGALVRLTSAESTLDALNGQIALRVTRAEYQADQDALTSRLSSAELTLNALDVPSITATVQAASGAVKDAEKQAEALLQDILSGERNRKQSQDALAFARSELSAAIQDGLRAEAQQRTQLAVQLGQNLAAVDQSLTALSAADVVEAQARLALAAQLESGLNQLNAAIENEQRVRADAVSAEALARQSLKAQLESVDDALLAAVEDEESARVAADRAEAAARQLVAARVEQVNTTLQASVESESQARATEIEAETSARQTLAAQVGSNHTSALAAAQAASDAAGGKGKVLFQSAAPAAADRLAQNLWIDTTGGANTPKRWNGTAWAVVRDKVAIDAAAAAAAAQQSANTALAQIVDERNARTTAISAEASARQTLTATVAANRTESMNGLNAAFAALSTEQSARASADGHFGALYTVRMQLGQGGQMVAGGFGLSGTSNGAAGVTIDFGVLANSFWVAAPNGSGVANVRPFSVQTTAQVVNGVVVPAGVYMDAAYINNATVLWGRFGTLVADTIRATSISASQLTAGNGVIGGSLKSSNYVAGSSGWQLRPDGVAEFSGVIVRGTIYATSGQIAQWRINGDQLLSGSFTGYAWPSSGTGVCIAHGGILLGNLNAGQYLHMTRDGNLYAPGLRIENGNAWFSGQMTAEAVNAVKTINLAGNAVTIPVGANAYGSPASASFYMDQPGYVMAIGMLNFLSKGGSEATVSININGQGQVGASLARDSSGALCTAYGFHVEAGWHHFAINANYPSDRQQIGWSSLTLLGAKR